MATKVDMKSLKFDKRCDCAYRFKVYSLKINMKQMPIARYWLNPQNIGYLL